MTDSVPLGEASPPEPKATPAAGRWAKLWGQLKRFRGPIAAIAAFGAVLSGLLGYWSAYQTVEKAVAPKSAPAAVATDVRSASGAPAFSVVILPFASQGGSAVDEQDAREATLDLTEAIGKQLPFAWVISPGLASTYRGKPNDPRVVGRELNVRYVVEAELRRAGDRVALTANLIDAGTAAQVWTDRAEIADANTGASALTVPPQLVSGLSTALVNAEIRRVARQGPAAAGAMDLVIRAWAVGRDNELDEMLEKRKLYGEALRLDPNLVSALIGRAGMSLEIARVDPRADRDALLREAEQLTNRALSLDSGDPRVWDNRGWVLALQRRSEESLTAFRESLRIAPNRSSTIISMVIALIWSGRAEESLPWIDNAIEHESGSMLAALYQRKCYANMLLGRYKAAAPACEKSVALGGDLLTYLYLAALYAQLDQAAKATSAKEQLLRRWPDFTLERWRLFIASDNKVYWDQVETHLFAGLRKVGIREK